MDIHQVKFGDYSLGNQRTSMGKKEEEKEEKVTKQQETSKSSVNAQEVLDAMDLVGIFNQFQVKQTAKNEVNPTDFLSEDRIDDIEAMMAEFDSGVSSIANIIAEEFGNSLPMDKVNELAAKIYASE